LSLKVSSPNNRQGLCRRGRTSPLKLTRAAWHDLPPKGAAAGWTDAAKYGECGRNDSSSRCRQFQSDRIGD